MADTGTDLVGRLLRAVNDHDLDGLVDCFSADYLNETPCHPERGFRGRAQVRTNWERLFAGIPDLTASVLRTAEAGGSTWSEWEMLGTRPDGDPHLMRGVVIFGVTDGRAAWARFYLEPADSQGGDVDAAISSVVGPGAKE